jgi:hypothetical protein
VDSLCVLPVDIHHRRAAEPWYHGFDRRESARRDVHHEIALALRGDDAVHRRLNLRDLRERACPVGRDQVDRRAHHLGEDLQAIHVEGRPRRGDVDDGIRDVDVRCQLRRPGDLRDLGADVVVGQKLSRHGRKLRGDGAAFEIRDRLDRPTLRRREDQPTAAKLQVQQRLERALTLADLVEPRDTALGRSVGDVLRDVGGTRIQHGHVGVDRVGVQFPVGTIDDVKPGPLEEAERRRVQTTLVRDGDTHLYGLQRGRWFGSCVVGRAPGRRVDVWGATATVARPQPSGLLRSMG